MLYGEFHPSQDSGLAQIVKGNPIANLRMQWAFNRGPLTECRIPKPQYPEQNLKLSHSPEQPLCPFQDQLMGASGMLPEFSVSEEAGVVQGGFTKIGFIPQSGYKTLKRSYSRVRALVLTLRFFQHSHLCQQSAPSNHVPWSLYSWYCEE